MPSSSPYTGDEFADDALVLPYWNKAGLPAAVCNPARRRDIRRMLNVPGLKSYFEELLARPARTRTRSHRGTCRDLVQEVHRLRAGSRSELSLAAARWRADPGCPSRGARVSFCS